MNAKTSTEYAEQTTNLRRDVYEKVLERMGFSDQPVPDRSNLDKLYKAWCRNIGYDNVLKRIYFAEQQTGPFPVMDPNDFLNTWMRHGTSGSCWPSQEALFGILTLTGYRVERVAGQMLECNDPMKPNHGSSIVYLDGEQLYIDTGMVAEEVLPLRAGEETATSSKAFGLWSKGDGNIWWRPGHSRQPIEVEIQFRNRDYPYFAHRYEKTKEFSLFNTSLYVRRNVDDEIKTFGRGSLITVNTNGDMTAAPVETHDLTKLLVEDMGLSEEIVARTPLTDDQGAQFNK